MDQHHTKSRFHTPQVHICQQGKSLGIPAKCSLVQFILSVFSVYGFFNCNLFLHSHSQLLGSFQIYNICVFRSHQSKAPVRTTEMRKMHCSAGGSDKVTNMASPTGNVQVFSWRLWCTAKKYGKMKWKKIEIEMKKQLSLPIFGVFLCPAQ